MTEQDQTARAAFEDAQDARAHAAPDLEGRGEAVAPFCDWLLSEAKFRPLA